MPPAANNPETPLAHVGERRHFYFNENGQPAYQIHELTADDFLNPYPGDTFFHGELHDRIVRALGSLLRHHYRYSLNTSVQLQTKVIWPDAALAQSMPDLVVVSNLSDQLQPRATLDIAAEQATSQANPSIEGDVTLRAIFEVTSPQLATIDLETKRNLYQRANIAEYWIIDTGLRPGNDQPAITIIGYRLQDGQYHPIAPTPSGHWESKICRLWLAITAEAPYLQIGDLRTGATYPNPADDENPIISAHSEANRRAQNIADQLNL